MDIPSVDGDAKAATRISRGDGDAKAATRISRGDGDADVRRRRYFAAVNVNPVDDQTVLGIFPVREGPRAFVAVALSRDGVRFSRFREILKSTAADQGRSTDHPVDGLLVRGDNVFLYAHRDVPPFSRGRPRIVRLETTLDELRAYTVKAKAELDAAWPPEEIGPVTIAYRPSNKTAAPLASGADRDLPRVAIAARVSIVRGLEHLVKISTEIRPRCPRAGRDVPRRRRENRRAGRLRLAQAGRVVRARAPNLWRRRTSPDDRRDRPRQKRGPAPSDDGAARGLPGVG